MKIKIFTVGGTIDKVYFDEKSTYEVGEPSVKGILRDANVGFEYECEALLAKDSLDMNDEDRLLVLDRIESDESDSVVVTHGTDTMVETGLYLKGKVSKVVVLTGALEPARFKTSDAVFNVACAVTAAQTLPPGVYIAMNGRVFDPENVRKNAKLGRFEQI